MIVFMTQSLLKTGALITGFNVKAENEMAKKLFIGGLSWNTTDEGLKKTFSQYGLINDAKIICDRETGRSRGFGFVTFDGEDDAAKAITGLDGKELDGRKIKVNFAEDKPQSNFAPRSYRRQGDESFNRG